MAERWQQLCANCQEVVKAGLASQDDVLAVRESQALQSGRAQNTQKTSWPFISRHYQECCVWKRRYCSGKSGSTKDRNWEKHDKT